MARSSARPPKRHPGGPSKKPRLSRADAAKAQSDHDNAWRQWVSDGAVEAVDTALTHVQTVVEDQVLQFGAFPVFVVTGSKDGEFELNSLDPADTADRRPDDVLEELRAMTAAKASDLVVAALAYPATLPDRSGARAVIVEVEHRERLSLEVVQEYKTVESKGKTFVNFGDPHTDRRWDPWLFTVRH